MRAQIHQHDRERVQVLDCLSNPLSPQKKPSQSHSGSVLKSRPTFLALVYLCAYAVFAFCCPAPHPSCNASRSCQSISIVCTITIQLLTSTRRHEHANLISLVSALQSHCRKLCPRHLRPLRLQLPRWASCSACFGESTRRCFCQFLISWLFVAIFLPAGYAPLRASSLPSWSINLSILLQVARARARTRRGALFFSSCET